MNIIMYLLLLQKLFTYKLNMNKRRIRIFVRNCIPEKHEPYYWCFTNDDIYDYLFDISYIKTIYK